MSAARPSIFRRLGEKSILFLVKLATLLWGNLSPASQRRWARLFLFLSRPLLRRQRKVALANLAIAFPQKSQKERNALEKKMFLHFITLGLDWLHFLRFPQDVPRRLIIPTGFRERCTTPNPDSPCPSVLYCTLHQGNWELEAHISLLTGSPGSVVVARFHLECLNQLAERLRTADDQTQIIPAEGAALGVYRALKEGRNVGLLIDQNVSPRHGGIFLKFFGLPAVTSPMPAAIARRLRIPIYVVSCLRQPDGTYVMEQEPLPQPAWTYPSDEALTAHILQAYEAMIRRHPEQYLWFYPRWKYLPANVSPEGVAQFPFYAIPKRYPCPESQLP